MSFIRRTAPPQPLPAANPGIHTSGHRPPILGDPAIANPVAKPAVTTTYTVLVTDINGCTATNSLTITVAPVLSATTGKVIRT
ncbi:MAG: hypothetical protein R2758_04235 [Bacteroidales bacterium]